MRGPAVLGCLALLLAGCSATPGVPVAPADAHPVYGLPAVPAPPGVVYQPDVEVVPGGAEAIREVSPDGLVWTIDRAAASGVEPGEVMFLTSRATGRVVRKQDRGDAVAVTLAPIQLQELLRDADLRADIPLDLAAATVHSVPDLPGALGEPGAEDSDVPLKLRADPPRVEGELGDWTVGGSVRPDGIALSLAYKPDDMFRGTVEVFLRMSSPTMSLRAAIAGGRLNGDVLTSVTGITAVDVTVAAGIGGTGGNREVRVELPAALINQPVVVEGVPMVLSATATLFVQTALTGKNSTLTAHGRWSLDGPIGLAGGDTDLPGFAVVDSILDSIGGIAIGPSGIVFGFEATVMVGVGVPGASAGPFGVLRGSVGVTNGSALGAPLARCRRADLVLKGGGGVGLSIGESAAAALAKAVPGMPPLKPSLAPEQLGTIVERSQTQPEVPLCTA